MEINMLRIILPVFLPLSSLFPLALSADEDAVLVEFKSAKSSAESDRAELLGSAEKWFKSRENEARSRGDKEAVDGVKRLREVFHEHEILPPNAPKDLLKKQQSYRDNMLSAFDAAIAEYTKLKKDDLASQKQLERRRFESDIKSLPFGTWEIRYFPGNVKATTTISDDLSSYHRDTVGRKEYGRIVLSSDGLTIRYSKFVEVWTPTAKGQELKVKHYFPASTFPEGEPSHEAIATRKPKQ